MAPLTQDAGALMDIAQSQFAHVQEEQLEALRASKRGQVCVCVSITGAHAYPYVLTSLRPYVQGVPCNLSRGNARLFL